MEDTPPAAWWNDAIEDLLTEPSQDTFALMRIRTSKVANNFELNSGDNVGSRNFEDADQSSERVPTLLRVRTHPTPQPDRGDFDGSQTRWATLELDEMLPDGLATTMFVLWYEKDSGQPTGVRYDLKKVDGDIRLYCTAAEVERLNALLAPPVASQQAA